MGMDYVKLLLDSSDDHKVKKKNKKKKKRKAKISLSEPVPMPSDIDPSSLPFDDDNDDTNHNVDFSPLPWELESIKLDSESIDNKIIDVETNISPKASNEIVKILPSLMNNKSLKTVLDENENENEDEKEDKNVFEQMDAALADYYKVFDRNDYFDKKGRGKFMIFVTENGLNDIKELEKYFGNETDIEPMKCKYLDFDDTFPLNEYAPQNDENEMDKKLMTKIEIYNVVEYCYHHRKSPY